MTEGFATAGSCAFINRAAFSLLVLLSMPKCLMRTSPFGNIPLGGTSRAWHSGV